MSKEIFHPDFTTIDLMVIENELGQDAFFEFMYCLQKVMTLIQRNHENNGTSLCEFPPLIGFRKIKFFSARRSQEGTVPDMRLIYRYEQSNDTVYYLAVGRRINQRPVSSDDIYQRIKTRDFNL